MHVRDIGSTIFNLENLTPAWKSAYPKTLKNSVFWNERYFSSSQAPIRSTLCCYFESVILENIDFVITTSSVRKHALLAVRHRKKTIGSPTFLELQDLQLIVRISRHFAAAMLDLHVS